MTGDDHETRFLNEGIDFKAKVRTCVEILALPFCRLGFGCFVKVVGDAVVPVARGEKMCYDTLRSLKVLGYCLVSLMGWLFTSGT